MSKKRKQESEEKENFLEEVPDGGAEPPGEDRSASEWSAGVEKLSRRIEELEEQRSEFRDLLQRKQAEFENYRKRTLRERDDIRKTAKAQVLKDLLPVVDACEKGLEGMPDPDGDPLLEGYLKGYQLLAREIRSLFERFEVETVPGTGQPFDPNLHEAVLRQETDQHEDGVILEEYRKGYRYGDYLLRPSQVKVAVRTEPPSSEAFENEQQEEMPSGPPESKGDEGGKVDIQA